MSQVAQLCKKVVDFAVTNTRVLITFPVDTFRLHRLSTEQGPSRCDIEVKREDLLGYYKDMLIIKEIEKQTKLLYKDQKIRGFCHVYSGQEACAVGIEAVVNGNDSVITAYRCHGWAFTRGIPIKAIMAEMMGRREGCSKGKGGSAHMYSLRQNFYGGHGIVGAQVPLGAGIAFALKYRDSKAICVTVYGDGAANQGQVFEAFNMAALWKLPCLFVCENNHYGMGTSNTRAAANPLLYTRSDCIPGIYVNGQDVLAVREATRWCTEYIRSGEGPIIMELDTYRYSGHSMSDPGKNYRKASEIKFAIEERDPIKIAQFYAANGQLATMEELEVIANTAKDTVKKAVSEALESPELPPEELFTDVYCESDNVVDTL